MSQSYKDRLNSNIFKNIFPEEVLDVEYFEELKNKTIRSYHEVKQIGHGFQVNDVVAYDTKKGYYKPLASANTKDIKGIVSKVRNADIFTLMDEGQLPYPHLNFVDTTILYLSDKNPGQLCHYKDIENMTYIPIAVCAGDSIIINILGGASGTPLAPYEPKTEAPDDFEPYSQQDLDDIIAILWGGPYAD